MTEPHNIVINLAPGAMITDAASIAARIGDDMRRADIARRRRAIERDLATATLRRDEAAEALASAVEAVRYWKQKAADLAAEESAKA